MGPPELTKDWSYERESHKAYIEALCVEEPYVEWLVRNETLSLTTLPSLRKRYFSNFNKELMVHICIDNTIDDELYSGRNYWTDLMFYVEEDAEITNILSTLSEIGVKLTEDSVYYNPNLNVFFITLNRTRDDLGPNLYIQRVN